MSAAGTPMTMERMGAAKPRGGSRCWTGLLSKELRESRAAIVAGLVIFWLMPAIWAIVFSRFERNEGVPAGMAWGLLAIAGWLFAVVVGAQAVCRDWGRPEEHFLLGRPVSARQVVWAKLWVGLAVVLLVALVAGAWDFVLATRARDWQRVSLTPSNLAGLLLCFVVPVLVLITTGFLLAFAAAVLTRQMLASVMLATMVLLIWVAAPLVSTRLEFLYPPWILSPPEHSGWPGLTQAIVQGIGLFLLIAVVVWGGLIGVALWAAAGERSIRLGQKTLAWGMALVVLGLFGVAMGEVGNSLLVRDQAMLDLQRGSLPAIACAGRQFFAVNDPISGGGTRIAGFRVDEKGTIRDMRSGELWFPKGLEQPAAGVWIPVTPALHVDEKGRLVITAGPFAEKPQRLHRFVVDWPAGGKPEVVSAGVAEPPPVNGAASLVLHGSASTRRYSYLVYQAPQPASPLPTTRPGRTQPPDRLYVFEWNDEVQARLVKDIPVHSGASAYIVGDTLVIVDQVKTQPNTYWLEWAAFDANRPEDLGTGEGWRYERAGWPDWWHDVVPDKRILCEFTGLGPRSGMGSRNVVTTTVGDSSVAYVSLRSGLRVRELAKNGEWKIVSEVRASPLAWAFRGQPQPLLLGASTLIEETESGTMWYDLSNTRHPRRVGFLNTAAADVYAFERHLVLFEDSLVTVVDRPAPGEPGGPIHLTPQSGYVVYVGEEDPFAQGAN